MPGQERAAPRAQAAQAAGPDGPEPAPSRSLASKTDQPILAGLIALLAALAFSLARWQTWANGNIGRFILVGQHFSTASQLPPGIPVAPTYGYDGQFF